MCTCDYYLVQPSISICPFSFYKLEARLEWQGDWFPVTAIETRPIIRGDIGLVQHPFRLTFFILVPHTFFRFFLLFFFFLARDKDGGEWNLHPGSVRRVTKV
jgi:hypothetical protein